MKKKICLIYTGGTIGMVHSDEGYVPSGEGFMHLLDNMPELKHSDFPEFETVVFSPLLDSSDMAVEDWNKLGRTIASRYHACDGFVVLHGTDTMAFSASALSFMLENLEKPVIFTGSQIPLYELRSDGRDNLISAMLLAASDHLKEVLIYFGGKLLRGNRSTKLSADGLQAFDSPNFPPLVHAGIDFKFHEVPECPPAAGPFKLQPFQSIPLGVLKVFPGIRFELFEGIMTESLKGVVLESFGAGNIPGAQTALLPVLRKAHENGSLVVVRSQCLEGKVNLGSYAASKALKDIGAVDGADMTTEASLAKLYYLFSKDLSPADVKIQFEKNLRGERS